MEGYFGSLFLHDAGLLTLYFYSLNCTIFNSTVVATSSRSKLPPINKTVQNPARSKIVASRGSMTLVPQWCVPFMCKQVYGPKRLTTTPKIPRPEKNTLYLFYLRYAAAWCVHGFCCLFWTFSSSRCWFHSKCHTVLLWVALLFLRLLSSLYIVPHVVITKRWKILDIQDYYSIWFSHHLGTSYCNDRRRATRTCPPREERAQHVPNINGDIIISKIK